MTQFDGFCGAEPEQIFGARSQQLPGRRTVVGHGKPAHHGHWHRCQFALDQIGCRRDLVGHRDLGDHQLVAVPGDDARIPVQHR